VCGVHVCGLFCLCVLPRVESQKGVGDGEYSSEQYLRHAFRFSLGSMLGSTLDAACLPRMLLLLRLGPAWKVP